MDSISRYCLLAYLKANPDMTYGEIVQFIESMQPMEVDNVQPYSIHNPYVARGPGYNPPGTVYPLWPTSMG